MPSDDHVRSGFAAPTGWQPLGIDGWHAWYLEQTGSTNADLLAASEAGAPHRTVLRAGHQTAGRGRLDRRWDAPPGSNLLVSILFVDVPDDAGALLRAVGVAAVDAVRAVAGLDARLKWPNDVLVGERKLAGILAQRAGGGSVVVGIGLNVGWAPEGAARVGDGHDPGGVLEALLTALDGVLALGSERLAARYRELLATLGTKVRVELAGGELVGHAVDVDADGRLMVVDECAITHRVDAGDVVHLRPRGG